MLLTDAFGARGGIAKFNRDFLCALCEISEIEAIVAYPRVIRDSIEDNVPDKILYRYDLANQKLRYFVGVILGAIKSKACDFVICGHVNLTPLAALVAWLQKTPYYLIAHGIDVWKKQPLLVKLALKTCSGIISVSQTTLDRFQNYCSLPNFKRILPNCVDLNVYRPGLKNDVVMRELGLCGRKVILSVGRILKSERDLKGYDKVIKILSRLAAWDQNILYVIVGEGDDLEYLKSLAKREGVEKNVCFAGYVEEFKKPEYYRCADVFVIPSKGEGFGIVTLEALACGIPVIASSADAGKEVVKNESWGNLIDPDNSIALEEAIKTSLLCPKKFDVEELKVYSCKAFRERVRSLIDEIKSRTFKGGR